MKTVIVLLFMLSSNPLEYNFGESKENSWYALNDGVMGGLSKGVVSYTDVSLVFEGEVSKDNNGGFASFRSNWGKYDLSNYKKMIITYKSSGLRFGFVAELSRAFYLPYYFHPLELSDEFITQEIILSDLKKYRLARDMNEETNTDDFEFFIRMGFINFDKEEKPFRIEIKSIKFE